MTGETDDLTYWTQLDFPLPLAEFAYLHRSDCEHATEDNRQKQPAQWREHKSALDAVFFMQALGTRPKTVGCPDCLPTRVGDE